MKSKLKIVKSLIKIALLQTISFRLDTLFGIISSILWLGIPIAFFKVIYLNVDTIGGWTYKECLLLVGVYTMLDGFLMAFLVKSMPKMEKDIREGTLDSILLKPINAKVYYFFSAIEFTQLINSVLGLFVIIYACQGISVNIGQVLFFLLSCVFGCILYYSLWYLWTISAFWFPTNFGRNDLFLSMIQMSRYPASIYRGLGNIIFNFILPFGLIACPATIILLRPRQWQIMLLQLLIALVFLFLDHWVWNLGLKKYNGAGR